MLVLVGQEYDTNESLELDAQTCKLQRSPLRLFNFINAVMESVGEIITVRDFTAPKAEESRIQPLKPLRGISCRESCRPWDGTALNLVDSMKIRPNVLSVRHVDKVTSNDIGSL